ncbi:hypothetical protein U9M48_009896, partial [Paspalum notatum var. saurae]
MERSYKFAETLLKYGYKGEYMSEDWLRQPLFIQCFAPTSLIYISEMTNSPKVFLIDDTAVYTQDTNQVFLIDDTAVYTQDTNQVLSALTFFLFPIMWTPLFSLKSVCILQSYDEITSDGYLAFIRKYVIGIGPWKDSVVPPKDNYLGPPTDLVARAHALNLQVHPYTFRNENKYLHFNFHRDPYVEYEYWLKEVGVDGLFTDFPGSLRNYQECRMPYTYTKKENIHKHAEGQRMADLGT